MSETLLIAKSVEEAFTRKGIHGTVAVIDPPTSYCFINANSDNVVREILAAVLHRTHELATHNNSVELAGEIKQCINLMGLQREAVKEH